MKLKSRGNWSIGIEVRILLTTLGSAGESILTGKGHEMIFWGDENIRHLHLGGGYMGLLDKKTWSCMFKMCAFYYV